VYKPCIYCVGLSTVKVC